MKINQALVHSAWSDHIAPEYANEQLFADLADHEELLPVPEILPEGGERFLDQPGSAIKDLVHRGAAAGIARCGQQGFLLTNWCCGEMLDAMQHFLLPLMVWLDDIGAEHLRGLLHDFPKLPVILQGVPREGYHRLAYPLMNQYAQLHVVCAVPHSVHRGVEYLVRRFGSEQLLFGTNLPVSDGGASIAGIAYAAISTSDREAIVSGNVKRLLTEVRRDG